MAECSGWCIPTIIYLVLAIISIIGSLFTNFSEFSAGVGLLMFLVNAVITGLWLYLMYWLCSTCRQGWSWFILLLPIILVIFFTIFGFGELMLTQPQLSNLQK